jgi:Tol biopolymer transport system component
MLTIIGQEVRAYDGPQHDQLVQLAMKYSITDQYLKQNLNFSDGINQKLLNQWKRLNVLDILGYGGTAEDFGYFGEWTWWNKPVNAATTRGWNHFHDPLKTWDDAGLDFIPPHYSSIVWGFSSVAQDEDSEHGDWDWYIAREYFYRALTSETNIEMEDNFANCFRSLGQIMHLVQDAAVPDHTRNDVHTYGDYERFINFMMAWHPTYLNRFLPNASDFPSDCVLTSPNPDSTWGGNVSPASGLIDRNQYHLGDVEIPINFSELGLAEYTNSNFFSNDTIFTYQHPSRSDLQYDSNSFFVDIAVARDGLQDYRLYLEKAHGEPVRHMVSEAYYREYLPDHAQGNSSCGFLLYSLDYNCYADYAEKLIPKAIGYSSKVLDYFFRGDIGIKNAHVLLGPNGAGGLWISGIRFDARNTTGLREDGLPDELFKNGTLDIVFTYFDPTTGASQKIIKTGIYQVYDEFDAINSNYTPITVTFSLGQTIPLHADQVTLTLVFRGTIGLENNSAVAAKVYPFESIPSRIAYYYQGNIVLKTPRDTGEKMQLEIRTPITGSTGSELSTYPAWNTPGTQLAYAQRTCFGQPPEQCTYHLELRDTATGNLIKSFYPVSEDATPYESLIMPSFSPDDSKIVATQSFDSCGLLSRTLTISETASNFTHYMKEKLFLHSNYPGFPSWSPDGNTIGYTHYHIEYIDDGDPFTDDRKLYGDIALIDPYGENQQLLTQEQGPYFNDTQPSWSPDGNWLVFASDRESTTGAHDIFIMDRYGSNLSKIYHCGPYDCSNPDFSSTGLRIVFKIGLGLYSVNLDGSDMIQIDGGVLNDFEIGFPTWGPDLSEVIPRIKQFDANPIISYSGEAVDLSWLSENALDQAGFYPELTSSNDPPEQSPVTVPLNGQILVTPAKDTTYTLKVKNFAGTTTRSVTVYVVTP